MDKIQRNIMTIQLDLHKDLGKLQFKHQEAFSPLRKKVMQE